MAKPTKKQLSFIVEIWEIEFYSYNPKGHNISFDYQRQHFTKNNTGHYLLPIGGLKKIVQQRHHSVKKLHQGLGIEAGQSYYFYNHINEFLKNQWGPWMCSLKLNPRFVFVVRQLHDLDGHYQVRIT